ncbi:uncharacterized protein LOC141627796 [Silene latifolia]|uniref:uncharacterized protein LOC141627796 n=1 Tax=Silene latifolia TaxID=37657 RepID=UPI003D776750
MANDTRTIRHLRARNYDEQPLCIAYPPMGANANFELKEFFIHNLSKFYGHAGNDPNHHLSEFHMMCEGAVPNGVTEDQFKLRAFPFSLQDAAKDWLFYFPSNSIATWKDMKATFLEKFYPDSRHNHAKKAITTVEQEVDETLYDYWERFKQLVAQCPYHGLSGDDLLVNFCQALTQQDQRLVNASTGGGVDNYSVADSNDIIERLASSTRNYGRKQDGGSMNFSSVGASFSPTQKLENDVSHLKQFVASLVNKNQDGGGGQGPQIECGFCQGPHPIETCPIMIEEGIEVENVSAMGHGNYNSRNPSRGGY